MKATSNRSIITGVNDLWRLYFSPEVIVKLTPRQSQREYFVKLLTWNIHNDICVDQQAFYHRSRNGYAKLAFIIHLRADVLSRLYLPDCNGELTHNNQQKPQTIEHLKIMSN